MDKSNKAFDILCSRAPVSPDGLWKLYISVYTNVGLGCVGMEARYYPTTHGIRSPLSICMCYQGDGLTNTARAHVYCSLAIDILCKTTLNDLQEDKPLLAANSLIH